MLFPILRNFHASLSKTKNFYEILETSPNASQSELKENYLKLAKKYHPDNNKLTTEKFLELKKAWEILGNLSKKTEYDKQLSIQLKFEKDSEETTRLKKSKLYDEKFDMEQLMMHQSFDSILAKGLVVTGLGIVLGILYIKLWKK